MLRVEVDANLARALASLQRATGGTQEAMRESADAAITGTWGRAVMSEASTRAERKLLATGADADVGPSSFTLYAGIGPTLSGGLENWPAIEYGMEPRQVQAPRRRRTIRIAGSGRPMRVVTQVWVGRNLRPRNPDGYAVFPAARKHGPKFVASWVEGLISQFDDVNDTALEIG